MIITIKILLFWFSTFGYLLWLKKKTEIPPELLLPITFSVIGIIVFLSGILNMMVEITFVIYLLGLILYLKSLLRKNINFKLLITPNLIIIFFVLLYISIICYNLHLLHYDNFSHWGLIAKTILSNNSLPNFENTIIEFKDYQPGSACFIYYFSLITGKAEGNMIIAQNYLLVSYYFSLLLFTNNEKDKKINYLLKILVTAFFLFILYGNVKFYNLLVDTLLATMSICSFVIMYYYKNNLKKAVFYILPISISLFLVKNTGIILVGFNCLMLIYLSYKNHQLKKNLKYIIITFIIPVLFFLMWSRHVSYVYGSSALSSKHALSTINIISELKNKGLNHIREFIIIYLKYFLNVTKNLPNKYMIAINIFLVLSIVTTKKYRNKIIECFLICNIIYLIYYLILGLMYLFSMPWEEARVLSEFNRYMLTIIFVVGGLVIINFGTILIKEKGKLLSYITISIISLMSVFINFKYNIDNYKIIFGDQDYEKTAAYKFDVALANNPEPIKNSDFYYIYAPNVQTKKFGYMRYLARFKLNYSNVAIVKYPEQIDEDYGKFQKKVLILDKDEKISYYLNQNNYQELSEKLLKKIS